MRKIILVSDYPNLNDLLEDLRGLPEEVTQLDISHCGSLIHRKEDIVRLLKDLPPWVSELLIDGNMFINIDTPENIAQLFSNSLLQVFMEHSINPYCEELQKRLGAQSKQAFLRDSGHRFSLSVVQEEEQNKPKSHLSLQHAIGFFNVPSELSQPDSREQCNPCCIL